jgi:(R,R)-butanediol dehydrogenase/meso-butanediol dehydrogenase/diacetyl reductase
VPESRLIALPDGVDLHAAGFVEPLAVTVHAVRRSQLRLGDTVMIAGAGPIGLGVALCARLAGAGEIFVSEPSPARRRIAEELGFTLLDPDDARGDLFERTGGELASVVFDTAAHPAVAAALASWTTTNGRIVFVGTYGKPTALDLQDIVFRELDTVGTRVYERADMETAVAMIATGRFDPSPLITGTVALADAPAALDRLRSGEDLKVLIDATAR